MIASKTRFMVDILLYNLLLFKCAGRGVYHQHVTDLPCYGHTKYKHCGTLLQGPIFWHESNLRSEQTTWSSQHTYQLIIKKLSIQSIEVSCGKNSDQ